MFGSLREPLMAMWIQCLIESNRCMKEADYLLNIRNVDIEQAEK